MQLNIEQGRGPTPKLLFKIGGGVLLLRVAGLLSQVLLFVLIARLLPLEQVGQYAVMNAIWMIFRQLGNLGLEQAFMRFLPGFYVAGDIHKANDFIAASNRVVFSFSFLVAVALFFVALVTRDHLALAYPVEAIIGAATALFAYSVLGVFVGQLRASGRAFGAQFPESFLLPTFLCAGFAVSAFMGIESIELLIAIQACCACSIAMLYMYMGDMRFRRVKFGLEDSDIAEIRTMSSRSFLSSAVSSIAVYLPAIILMGIKGSAAVAIYETASRFGRLPSLATWAVGVTLSPMLSEEHHRGNRENLQHIFTLGCWMAGLPALLYFISTLIFGRYLLVYFLGDNYEVAYWPMLIFSLAIAVNASAGLSSVLLMMTGFDRVALIFSLFSMICLFLGVVLFGNAFGVIGVALAFLLSTIVRDVGLSSTLSNLLDIQPGVYSRHGFSYIRRFVSSLFG